jgi:putative flavoprotein involved in K+ transport
MPETIAFLESYAVRCGAPVQTQTPVTSISSANGGYRVFTPAGEWHCRTVVVASGACNIPRVPEVAAALPPRITTLTPKEYRNPQQVQDGGVLVVGASATGTQLAEELQLSGRPVTLAVGEHIRAPRVYRGRDIKWWMDAAGVMDDRHDEQDDILRARGVPSLQLAGTTDRRSVDLNRLTGLGVRLVGRLAGIQNGRAQFSGSLRNQCELADLKMNRLLDRIDEWAKQSGLNGDTHPPHRFEPTRVEHAPPLGLDLASGEIRTVIWATGFRPDYSWIDVPVLDRKGRIKHDGGVVEAPGMYLMGLPFLRRRKSTLIDGAADDARELSAHLASYLDGAAATEA